MAASSTASAVPLSQSSFVYPEVPQQTTPGQICGRLVHPNGDPFISKRISFNVYVPKTVLGLKCYESKITENVQTDQHGYFSFSAKKINGWLNDKNIRLTYDVFEKNVHYCPGKKNAKENLVYSTVKENDDGKIGMKVKIEEQGNNLGNIRAEVYEYEQKSPNLRVPEDMNLRPQKWPYNSKLIMASMSKALKKLATVLNPFETTAQVQFCFEAGDPSLKISSETTIDMLLNGIFPCYFKKMDGGKLKLDINWDEYDKDIAPILPNATLILTKNTEGKLDVESVTLEISDHGKKTYLKEDPLFEHALYLFNCSAAVKGEVVSHLGMGHLWTEQVAMAAYRSLANNPIAKLLLPHLKGVVEINRMGKSAIFGKDGILNVSGLTETGIRQALNHVLEAMDYATFTPRTPLENENHPHAQAAQIIWEAFSRVVNKFVDENLPEITKNWNEIFLMSKNLVLHSMPYRPMDGEWDCNVWHDTNEIDDPSVSGRVEHDGEVKAVRPITTNFDGPAERDIDRLKQFCSYSIFMATYWHWSVHTSQKKWMTNLEIASLAPQQFPESKDWNQFAGLKPEDATAQLVIAKILVDLEMKSLYDNEFEDIHRGILDALRDNLHKLDPHFPNILEMTPAVQI